MPTVETIVSILKNAGHTESAPIPARLGSPARNMRGFRAQGSAVERRVVYVYHVGRDIEASLSKYEATLQSAGMKVLRGRGGLHVTQGKSRADRATA